MFRRFHAGLVSLRLVIFLFIAPDFAVFYSLSGGRVSSALADTWMTRLIV